MREINSEGLNIIKSFEGILDGDPTTVNLDPYLDPVGIWTIGWGHAIRYKGAFLRGEKNKTLAFSLYPGGLTVAQCTDLLRADTLNAARDVASVVKVDMNDNQFSALVSFTFNAGIGNLSTSTLLKRLNASKYDEASGQFQNWNKSRNEAGVLVALNGLTRRRAAERALFVATQQGSQG